MDVQTAYRAAALALLDDYASSVSLDLTTYPGRPASIHPPHAFVDRMGAVIDPVGPDSNYQHEPSCEVVILHGDFDSAVAVAQRDAFVDGFVLWVKEHIHEAGSNTLINVASIEDEPTYVPDWLPPEYQRTYYGTRITLEGYVGDN